MDNSFLTTIGMLVVLGGVFYLFLYRPQQKKMKEQQAKLNAVDVGTRVMLTSGILGTVRHSGERQVIIEVSPGLEITVVRKAIMSIVDPADEEFEYEDEATAIEADDTDQVTYSEPTNEEIAAFLEQEAAVNRGDETPAEAPDDPDTDAQTKPDAQDK